MTADAHPGGAINFERPSQIFVMDEDSTLLTELDTVASQLGCEVVGPLFALPREIGDLVRYRGVDAAVINLVTTNGSSDAIIRAFQSHGVPVIIRSSLMRNAVGRTYPNAEVLDEPYSAESLRLTLLRALKKSDEAG